LEWGLLHYWHRDQTRIWLVRRSDALVRWMLRRLDLAAQHVLRRVPIAETNKFFPWMLYPGGKHFPGATCSDWLRYKWFGYCMNRGKPPQPPNGPTFLTYADWTQELAALGLVPGAAPPRPAQCPSFSGDGAPSFTDKQNDAAAACATAAATDGPPRDVGDTDMATVPCAAAQAAEQRDDAADPSDSAYWQDVVEGGAFTDVSADSAVWAADKGLLYLPEKPQIWAVYEHFRCVPPHETDITDPAKVALHDPDDAAWFAQQFPSVMAKAAAALAWPFDDAVPDEDGLPSTRYVFCGRGPEQTRMNHLFLTRIELDPARELGPPAVTQLEGAELECFRELMAEEEAKAERKKRALEQKHEESAQQSAKRRMYSAPASDSERQTLLSRWFGGGGAAKK